MYLYFYINRNIHFPSKCHVQFFIFVSMGIFSLYMFKWIMLFWMLTFNIFSAWIYICCWGKIVGTSIWSWDQPLSSSNTRLRYGLFPLVVTFFNLSRIFENGCDFLCHIVCFGPPWNHRNIFSVKELATLLHISYFCWGFWVHFCLNCSLFLYVFVAIISIVN